MLVEVDVVDLSEADEYVSVPVTQGSRTCLSHATGRKNKLVDGRTMLRISVADSVRVDLLNDLILDRATNRVFVLLGIHRDPTLTGASASDSCAEPPVGAPTLVAEATPEEVAAHARGGLRELRIARSLKP